MLRDKMNLNGALNAGSKCMNSVINQYVKS